MAVTIHDVAKRAGVSISTVSRVLNDTCKVNPDKRRRVQAAVEALGYVPNQMARSLLMKETGGLGVVLPYVGGEFFSEFLNALDQTTHAHGYYLMISISHRNLQDMMLALKGMHRRVDGLVLMAPEGQKGDLEALIPPDTPVVLVNTQTHGLPYDAVNFDNFGGAHTATTHLIKLGHRRIAMLKGPAHAYDAQERLRGYRAALQDAGLSVPAGYEINGDFTSQAGYAAAEQILTLQPRPTAVFGANDQSTIALMGALKQAGLRVPEDVSLVGFDNIPSAQYSSPPLTSVEVPIQTMGEAAIKRLMTIIDQEDEVPLERVLPAPLMPRQSSGPVPVT